MNIIIFEELVKIDKTSASEKILKVYFQELNFRYMIEQGTED